jgi:hypothetical protein
MGKAAKTGAAGSRNQSSQQSRRQPGKGFLARSHCGSQLRHRSQKPPVDGERSARRQAKADFCLLFGSLQKVRRPAGRDPPVLPVIHTNKNTQNLTSPVPAGCRVAFFARPKKVTKERTCTWRWA